MGGSAGGFFCGFFFCGWVGRRTDAFSFLLGIGVSGGRLEVGVRRGVMVSSSFFFFWVIGEMRELVGTDPLL